MSYCRYRKGESDVYVIGTRGSQSEGGLVLECCGCPFNTEVTYDEPAYIIERHPDPDHWTRGLAWKVHSDFATEQGNEMIVHLESHRIAGHLVPQRAIDRISEEMEKGEWL